MDFESILYFAIEREEEAAAFYHDLKKKVKSPDNAAILEELELMELKHKEILEEFMKTGMRTFKMDKIADLKISDFMINIEPKSQMTYQEILIIAIKREEYSRNLYAILAEDAEDEGSKQLFLKLASEESKHKLKLETLYDEEILSEN